MGHAGVGAIMAGAAAIFHDGILSTVIEMCAIDWMAVCGRSAVWHL